MEKNNVNDKTYKIYHSFPIKQQEGNLCALYCIYNFFDIDPVKIMDVNSVVEGRVDKGEETHWLKVLTNNAFYIDPFGMDRRGMTIDHIIDVFTRLYSDDKVTGEEVWVLPVLISDNETKLNKHHVHRLWWMLELTPNAEMPYISEDFVVHVLDTRRNVIIAYSLPVYMEILDDNDSKVIGIDSLSMHSPNGRGSVMLNRGETGHHLFKSVFI